MPPARQKIIFSPCVEKFPKYSRSSPNCNHKVPQRALNNNKKEKDSPISLSKLRKNISSISVMLIPHSIKGIPGTSQKTREQRTDLFFILEGCESFHRNTDTHVLLTFRPGFKDTVDSSL